MPNHCYNKVQLSNNAENDSKQFDELVAKFESGTPFNEILPMPDFSKIKNEDGELPVRVEHKNQDGEVMFTTSEFPTSGRSDDRWYDWANRYWGTKWEAYDFSSEEVDEYTAEFTFNTAWGPADGVFAKIKQDYPDVGISWFYDEPGCELAGYLPN